MGGLAGEHSEAFSSWRATYFPQELLGARSSLDLQTFIGPPEAQLPTHVIAPPRLLGGATILWGD